MVTATATPRAVRQANPEFEPVSVAEAKKQIELPSASSTHDEHLSDLIAFAREQVEHDTGIVAATGTFVLSLDEWPCDEFIRIAERPLTSVTSIYYLDETGNSTLWASSNYTVDTARNTIWQSYDVSWPILRAVANAVTITFVAGAASSSAIQKMIRQAILLRVSAEFNNRDGVNEHQAYESLISRLMRSSYP